MSDPLRTTVLSTKGQVVLPAAVRAECNWRPGTRLNVEVKGGVVSLSAVPLFRPTTIDQVSGCLRYEGAPVSIEDMDIGGSEVFRRDYGHEYDRD